MEVARRSKNIGQFDIVVRGRPPVAWTRVNMPQNRAVPGLRSNFKKMHLVARALNYKHGRAKTPRIVTRCVCA